MEKPKSYRDLKYDAVVAYGDKKGLNTETHENWRLVAQQMFNEKYGKKKNASTDRMGKFLSGINFSLLKDQKQTLLKVLEKTKTTNTAENLTGILHLIDSLQDIAVDEYGYKERKVFKLSRKDK